MTRNHFLWLIWAIATLVIGGFLTASAIYGGNRSFLLIGQTTSGHHQIELACDACHGDEGFSNAESIQKACLSCHQQELRLAKDSHPVKKFRDPRNADRLAKLNAKLCVTCHTEHKPGITHPMGVTLPPDYCVLCHKDIGKERPINHQNLDFTTCASAGCHNYHDNRALYENFLERRADEPEMKLKQYVKNFDAEPLPAELGGLKRGAPLSIAQADAPENYMKENYTEKAKLVSAWHNDAHAQKGVNCSGCHTMNVKFAELKDEAQKAAAIKAAWIEKPGREVCASCHTHENKTFLLGKHGMRLQDNMHSARDGLWGFFKKTKLSPMKPELARAPMSLKAHGRELGCVSCHGAHKFDVQKAKVEACLSCHNDEHSKAYVNSPHHELLKKERSGALAKGSGVSCATCHMPRQAIEDEYENEIVVVNHNQNDTLRPNEKMIRPVCSSCHGLQFTLDALADKKLIKKNFTGRPKKQIESINWTLKRAKKIKAEE